MEVVREVAVIALLPMFPEALAAPAPAEPFDLLFEAADVLECTVLGRRIAGPGLVG